MPSDERPPGFWNLAKELTTGVWDITKEVGKETREGIKSYSENAKMEAQKHHLEHSKKIKIFKKRAKDAGITEESLDKFIKEEEFEQKKSEEPEGSGSLLEGISNNLGMWHESVKEARFEQYIRHFNNNKKMYKEAVARNDRTLDLLKEILKDSNFIWSEIEAAAESEIEAAAVADEGSCQKNFDQTEEYSNKGNEKQALAKLNKDFGATQVEPREKITEFLKEHKANLKESAQEDINHANEYSKKGNEEESISKSILNPYFSSLIEKYLSNYQAIEQGEILQENLIPRKASRNNFRAVCKGEKKAVTAHEQAYMAWKKQAGPPQNVSTEPDIDLP
jgi:hypothetical protein